MSMNADKLYHELDDVVADALGRSRFFTGLQAGTHDVRTIRAVFTQYYHWRNQFHRWFGACLVNSPPFGSAVPAARIVGSLAEHMVEEIEGDHHGLCAGFMDALGAWPVGADPSTVTLAYSDSFLVRFAKVGGDGAASLAALAGREVVAPRRNREIRRALQTHYGVETGLEFLVLHEELEVEHFVELWSAAEVWSPGRTGELTSVAIEEIRRHVDFWDDALDEVPVAQLASATGA